MVCLTGSIILKEDHSSIDFNIQFNSSIGFMDKLEHLSVIKVSGEDADEFLQGQMTQSTEAINNDRLHLTSFCNPQGRVLATALIQSWNEAYYLILSSDLIDDLITCLNRYILRSKVYLNKEEINIFGINVSEKNNSDQSFIQSKNQSLRSLANDDSRLILLSYNDEEEQFQTISKEDWIIQDIKTGLPLINKINTIKYIPQMLNLDDLNAVSFTKGCYTGQEVVARVQHRGKIKQRMYQLEIETDDFVSPQVEVRNIDKKVGSVVMSARSNNICHALAVINIDYADKNLSINGCKVNLN